MELEKLERVEKLKRLAGLANRKPSRTGRSRRANMLHSDRASNRHSLIRVFASSQRRRQATLSSSAGTVPITPTDARTPFARCNDDEQCAAQ
jgi:hypothetical protein